MKMNKILLGVTAVLFAAGAAFASVNIQSSQQQGWYRIDDQDPFSCTEYEMVDCDLTSSENCVEDISGHGPKVIYSNNLCNQPLQRELGF